MNKHLTRMLSIIIATALFLTGCGGAADSDNNQPSDNNATALVTSQAAAGSQSSAASQPTEPSKSDTLESTNSKAAIFLEHTRSNVVINPGDTVALADSSIHRFVSYEDARNYLFGRTENTDAAPEDIFYDLERECFLMLWPYPNEILQNNLLNVYYSAISIEEYIASYPDVTHSEPVIIDAPDSDVLTHEGETVILPDGREHRVVSYRDWELYLANNFYEWDEDGIILTYGSSTSSVELRPGDVVRDYDYIYYVIDKDEYSGGLLTLVDFNFFVENGLFDESGRKEYVDPNTCEHDYVLMFDRTNEASLTTDYFSCSKCNEPFGPDCSYDPETMICSICHGMEPNAYEAKLNADKLAEYEGSFYLNTIIQYRKNLGVSLYDAERETNTSMIRGEKYSLFMDDDYAPSFKHYDLSGCKSAKDVVQAANSEIPTMGDPYYKYYGSICGGLEVYTEFIELDEWERDKASFDDGTVIIFIPLPANVDGNSWRWGHVLSCYANKDTYEDAINWMESVLPRQK